MLLDELQKTMKSETDQNLAEYILKHPYEVCEMNTRQLSEKVFVSPATVVRFSKRLGYSGFQELKMKLNAEIYASRGLKNKIDADFPVHADENIKEIIKITSDLSWQAIEKTGEMMERNGSLKSVIRAVAKSTGIDIYGIGFALDSAVNFKNNMNRIGVEVFMDADVSRQTNWAARADKKHFSILLSYSGETSPVCDVARVLKKRKMQCVSITCEKENTLAKQTTWNLPIVAMESPHINSQVASLSSNTAFNFVLNIIYLGVFSSNYEKNRDGICYSLEIQKKDL